MQREQLSPMHSGTAPTVHDYAAGRRDDYYARQMTDYEIRAAIEEWRAAASDHGHTSFWGPKHVRDMRGYWLGVRRRRRELVADGVRVAGIY